MIARNVTLQLKPNMTDEFTRKMETEIVPLLKKQAGFKNEIAFVFEGGKEAVGISLWDTKEHADAYNRETYPKVIKSLETVILGNPTVRGGELKSTTIANVLSGNTR